MTDKVLCRYFAVNACKKGDACPFSHNPKDQPSNVCTFYLRGNCTYGANCRYEHVSARKLAETQGWGPLSAKLTAGGFSASENSPPSVLTPAPSLKSPTAKAGLQIGSPIPTRVISADGGGVKRDGASSNGGPVSSPGKSWADLAAKPRKEVDLTKVAQSAPKVKVGRSTEGPLSDGPCQASRSANGGPPLSRDPSSSDAVYVPGEKAGLPAEASHSSPSSAKQPVPEKRAAEQQKEASNVGSSSAPVTPPEQDGNAKESSEEFDVQRGAWRPPHLQEGLVGTSTPDIPNSISPGLNSSARAFSPSAYQDPNGGQYLPAAGYPPHMMQQPGGTLMVPTYGLTDENGIPYEDNVLPDDLWDWVDQVTITDQDDYAAMNGYDMQGVAYMPGQPYPQSFSPSPPIPYMAGQMYPQTYSPAPFYPEQQYPQPYPDGTYPQPYPAPPQVYPANPHSINPDPLPAQAPQAQPENPAKSEPSEDPSNPGLVRSNSLEDFPLLANPNPSVTDGANPNDPPGEQPICPFAAAGDCPREKDGGACSQLHGDRCPSCGKRCLHPSRPEERKEHLEGCERRAKKLKQLQKSQEVECCVCLERVLSKPRIAERKFGILSGCDHAFCIACIRGWRSGDHTTPGMDLDTVVRSCPVCRVQSYFVTPSVVWYASPEEKDQILEGYKRKLKAIDCRHFNYGVGSCPFGTSCFYRHRFKDGREEEVVLRHLGTADGTVAIAKSVRLSDFIDLSALKKRR